MQRARLTYLVASCVCLAVACSEKSAPPASAPPPPTAPAVKTAAPAVAPPEPEQPFVKVARLVGQAEVLRNEGEQWTPLAEGDRLLTKDAIRTGGDATMDLELNEGKVRVFERSEFKVKVLSETALKAQVKGRVEGDIPEGKGSIEIQAEGSDAVVASAGGRFAVSANGRGIVVVANVRGSVKLSSQGGSVEVPEGRIGRVRPGVGPEKPSRALSRVLLSVDWPERKTTNVRTLPVMGRVEVGSQVLVQGKPVDVDEQGRFRADVALRNGRQRVGVAVVDVLGRKKDASTTIELDDKAPEVRLKENPW